MSHLPNIVTLTNLFFGSLAAVFVLSGAYGNAFVCLLICFVADFLDGTIARLMDTSSDVGAELDSLADMISFGFVPGAMLYMMIGHSHEVMVGSAPDWLPYVGFFYTVMAGLRLARFNVDEDQSYSFRGLPTPATAAAVFGLLIIEWLALPWFQVISSSAIWLTMLTVLLGAFMNMNFRVFSFKFAGWGWQGNQLKYLTLLLCIPLIVIFKEAALLPAIGVYLLLSLLTDLGILPYESNFNPPTHEISG